ncbi:MAG: orc1/cdc6 family replication initiation protein [Nanoarchaeota archaeon]
MMEIDHFFKQYLTQKSLFLSKVPLSATYLPEQVPYREEQLQEIANILAPALRQEKPSNLFIYGKPGTGKTLSTKHIIHSITSLAEQKNIPLRCIYINCKLRRVADTEYRLVAQLIKEYGKEVPVTGLPTDQVYHLFYTLLDQQKHLVLLVLDEIDQLTSKIGDEILYNLTRINTELKQSQLSIIGISNNLIFAENLDPRIKSSLSEEELVFPPYNAVQIQDILRQRSSQAFRDGTMQAGVIEKCAAYAAREHGDARKAIDLLRVAGEIAERSGSEIVQLQHLDEAQRKIEHDTLLTAALSQPKQVQAILYSLLILNKDNIFTGEIYDLYRRLCRQHKLNVLTQRRVSDILAELDMLGLITARIISKGRYGRTRDISLNLEENVRSKLKELLEKSLLA